MKIKHFLIKIFWANEDKRIIMTITTDDYIFSDFHGTKHLFLQKTERTSTSSLQMSHTFPIDNFNTQPPFIKTGKIRYNLRLAISQYSFI